MNTIIILQSVALIFSIHLMEELVREVTDQEIEHHTFVTSTIDSLVSHLELVRMTAHGLEMPQHVNAKVSL